ncbi:epimerase [Cytophagales bacterium WSM2-2]|nr:epimerase [Cytophagales bacterium WSM2-2]
MGIKVIITGVTGMVGEGVLYECLQNPEVEKVLMVNRKPFEIKHQKLSELIVKDFLNLDEVKSQLSGYDACFFCAGISSIGLSEVEYRKITYDVTLHFAQTLVSLNPAMVFNYVSGASTDSSENGKIMWARVKGKTENDLLKLPFKKAYNFRPGFMYPTAGQKNMKSFYKYILWLYPILKALTPNSVSTLRALALAMIHSVTAGYSKSILEVRDIKALAKID